MLRLVVVLVTLVTVTGCLPMAELEQGPGIIGSYVVTGVDPLGTEYTGRVEIGLGARPDEITMDWIVTGAIIHGEGVIDGDRVTVSWETVTSPQGRSTGTALYEILDDGRLVGTRTVDGLDQVGTETIFPDP